MGPIIFVYLNAMPRGKAVTQVKGHESELYKTLRETAGPFFTFTTVKMKGPNKSLKPKKRKD